MAAASIPLGSVLFPDRESAQLKEQAGGKGFPTSGVQRREDAGETRVGGAG